MFYSSFFFFSFIFIFQVQSLLLSPFFLNHHFASYFISTQRYHPLLRTLPMKSPHSEEIAIWMSNHPFESFWAEHFPDGRVEQVSTLSFYQLHPYFTDESPPRYHYLDQCTRTIQRQRSLRRHRRHASLQYSPSPESNPRFLLHSDPNGPLLQRPTRMQALMSGKQNITLLFKDQPNDSGYFSLNYTTYRATEPGKPPRIFTEFFPIDFIMPTNRLWWTNMQSHTKSNIDSTTIKQLSKCTVGLWQTNR